jgi:hypothetical protein
MGWCAIKASGAIIKVSIVSAIATGLIALYTDRRIAASGGPPSLARVSTGSLAGVARVHLQESRVVNAIPAAETDVGRQRITSIARVVAQELRLELVKLIHHEGLLTVPIRVKLEALGRPIVRRVFDIVKNDLDLTSVVLVVVQT